MADEKKSEVISKSGKLWRNVAIGIAILFFIVVLLFISVNSKELSDFLSKQGGIIFFGLLTFGFLGAVLYYFLKKRENDFDLEKAISEIRQKEYKLHGIIINPADRVIDEIADSFLIEFEQVDSCDGNPPKRISYIYNKKSRLYYPFSLGTKKDAKLNIEQSQFFKQFLGAHEAEQKLKELQDRMGVTIEKS